MSMPFQFAARYPLYIANQAVQPMQWLDVEDKYTGQKVTQVGLADADLMEQAIAAAVAAERPMAQLKTISGKRFCCIACGASLNGVRSWRRSWWWKAASRFWRRGQK
jgi:hypothetical protein